MLLQERRVWAAETPVLLLKYLVKEENVEKRSEDGSCGSEQGVQVGYPDNGDSISGGCGRELISLYSTKAIYEVEVPLSGESAFFIGGHEQR